MSRSAFKNFPRTVTIRFDDAGICRAFEADGTVLPLNRAGYKTGAGVAKALFRFYNSNGGNGDCIDIQGVRDENAETAPRDEAFSGRMVDHEIAMEQARALVASREADAAREVEWSHGFQREQIVRIRDGYEFDGSTRVGVVVTQLHGSQPTWSVRCEFGRAIHYCRPDGIEVVSEVDAAMWIGLNGYQGGRDGSGLAIAGRSYPSAWVFPNDAIANRFMSTEHGTAWGVLGEVPGGVVVARMTDTGRPAMVAQPAQQAQGQHVRVRCPEGNERDEARQSMLDAIEDLAVYDADRAFFEIRTFMEQYSVTGSDAVFARACSIRNWLVSQAGPMAAMPVQQAQSKHNAYRHHSYNRDNYPHFICNHGNWDIYSTAEGYCASIPTDDAARDGCLATHFGDARYVRVCLGVDVMAALPKVAMPVQQAQAQDMRGPLDYPTVRKASDVVADLLISGAPGELVEAYRFHRKLAAPRILARHRREQTGAAVMALEAARRDVAKGTRRYTSADHMPGPFAPVNPELQAARSAGPTRGRWIETPGDIGLRFIGWSDKIRSMNHQGWYTSENGDNGEVLRGCVYQLPSRDGRTMYVPAYGDPSNGSADTGGPAFVYFDEVERGPVGGWNDDEADDAAKMSVALIADRRAESAADTERAYNEAWQAVAEYVSLGEEYGQARGLFVQAFRALKTTAATLDPGGMYRRGLVCEFLARRDELQGKRDRLAREFMNTDAFREHLA